MIELLFPAIFLITLVVASWIAERKDEEEPVGNRFIKYEIKEDRWY